MSDTLHDLGFAHGDPTEKLFERARLGIEIEGALASNPVARAILDCALRDARNALRALLNTDPHDTAQVQVLQNEIQRYIDFHRYLTVIVEGGRGAADDISAAESSDD